MELSYTRLTFLSDINTISFFDKFDFFWNFIKQHRDRGDIMLKSLVCTMLLVMSMGILNASEAAGRAVVKKFWKSINYCQLDTMEYITDDFTSLSQGQKKDREQTEKYIRLFNQYISLAKKQKYAEAMEIFVKLLEQSNVKTVGKRDTRKFSELSPKEQQQTIAFIKKSANSFPDKYTVKKNQSMKITSFSISGDQATALISFQGVFKSKTAEIKLKKVNGKWLVSQITDN